ncbi:MAG: bacillithiol system redox-active protein YtxJ [Chitinophagales bacterium]|nr:bacillithiol system redox-active protein YtxJ [Chitinophagales bacterium]
MINWIEVNQESQLKELLDSNATFAVFKHSTRCSISSMVKNRLEREWQSDAPVYYLDLLNHRALSNWIATVSGVVHESPQIIVFKKGKACYDASHTAINALEIAEQMK